MSTRLSDDMQKVRAPETEAEYILWAKETLGIDYTHVTERVYVFNSIVAKETVQKHDFFKGIDQFLRDCNSRQNEEDGSNLLMSIEALQLDRKPYLSMLNKSFRKNIVLNDNFPNAPDEGWVTPDTWYDKINDIVRGTIVCKFIDGPKKLADMLTQYALQFDLKSRYNSQQNDDGYYAYHFYVKVPVDLNDQKYNSISVDLDIELQLTTQLQEIIYKITHPFYHEHRDKRATDPSAWKWEVNTNRFKAGYLGHTLHLLEAIILELKQYKKQ